MVIVITQLHTTFMVLLAIVPFFMIPVFADVEVEGVSGFYGHDDAYNVIGVVKNSGNYSALAAVTIQLEYGNTVVETTVYTHNIKANGTMASNTMNVVCNCVITMTMILDLFSKSVFHL